MVIDGINDDDHVLFVIKRVSPEIVSVRQQSNSNGFSQLLPILCVCLEHYSDDAYDGTYEDFRVADNDDDDDKDSIEKFRADVQVSWSKQC